MSAPGSKIWWVETALICASGVALAIWLWDGPVFVTTLEPVSADAPQTEITPASPRTIVEMFEYGCVTSEHLQAMREGRTAHVLCPVEAFAPTAPNAPPADRLFP
ncbi:hypothetical protein [Gymnodinialimonas hymeniacidonis]|uniref:hypothetical protein n=1 Tax=Gymnodinialimonas hymeniacidonis TaxID=3126508 RepID=UPI0034C5F24B